MKSSQVASVVATVLSRMTLDERRGLARMLTQERSVDDLHAQFKQLVLAHTANYAFVRGAIRNPFDDLLGKLVMKP